MDDERSDAQVIAESLHTPEAFEPVFRAHYQTIRVYLQRRLGSDAGEELAAQTFTVAFDRRGSYDMGYPSARPWLFAIATNLLRHHLRDARTHQRAIARSQVVDTSDEAEIDDRLSSEAASTAVQQALDGLSQADRETLLLFAVGELSYSEVSSALGVPLGTVRSRINRARRTLREQLPGFEAIMGVGEEPDDVDG